MNKIILITFLISITLTVLSQENKEIPDLKKQAYQAYLLNSIGLWEEVVVNFSKRIESSPDDIDLLFQLTEAQYGLLNTCLANKDKDTFEKYIKKADENVESLLENNETWSAAHALKSGLYSIKMGFFPMKGMIYGQKNAVHIQKALKHDDEEPLAWIQDAGSKFFTPPMFGGNTKEAISSYQTAVGLFEKNKENLTYNWQYLNTLAWLGIALQKENRIEEAIDVFEKSLRFESNFAWVKYHLLPSAKEN